MIKIGILSAAALAVALATAPAQARDEGAIAAGVAGGIAAGAIAGAATADGRRGDRYYDDGYRHEPRVRTYYEEEPRYRRERRWQDD